VIAVTVEQNKQVMIDIALDTTSLPAQTASPNVGSADSAAPSAQPAPIAVSAAPKSTAGTAQITDITKLPSIWTLESSIEWLIDDLIPLGSVNLITSESGTGKTWVAYVSKGIPIAISPESSHSPILAASAKHQCQKSGSFNRLRGNRHEWLYTLVQFPNLTVPRERKLEFYALLR
jgi:hypothetical protein